jgi:hypothetical protein
MLSVHRNAVVRTIGTSTQRRVFHVDVFKVHPVVMARARIIASNDHTRIKIISPTEVLIINYKGWMPVTPVPRPKKGKRNS